VQQYIACVVLDTVKEDGKVTDREFEEAWLWIRSTYCDGWAIGGSLTLSTSFAFALDG
jgi:hypothetical protein